MGFRLVLNHRANKLDQYISLKLVQAVGNWGSDVPSPPKVLTLAIALLLPQLASWAAVDAEVLALARRFPSIHARYEDVRRGHGLDAVQAFLGVEPVVLSGATVRARTRTRRDTVANFDEVAEALAGTPWADDSFAEE